MNLGKPRRRLSVADRPGIDIDADFGTDVPAESEAPREHAPVAGSDRDEVATDDQGER